MYLIGTKACCTQAFAIVLAISSEVSEERCLKCIPDLVRSRTVLLRLGSGNSCPTIRLIESEMVITFPSEACASTCTWKTYLLLKRQFKGIC